MLSAYIMSKVYEVPRYKNQTMYKLAAFLSTAKRVRAADTAVSEEAIGCVGITGDTDISSGIALGLLNIECPLLNGPILAEDMECSKETYDMGDFIVFSIASQYWCLLRKLPLIIGDQVPDGDEHWSLLLQLVDVVDLIMAPKVDDGTLAYLEMQLFKGFQNKFPGERITPKMHYNLHYPHLMREVGPLIQHWVMRYDYYEAKHHLFKRELYQYSQNTCSTSPDVTSRSHTSGWTP